MADHVNSNHQKNSEPPTSNSTKPPTHDIEIIDETRAEDDVKSVESGGKSRRVKIQSMAKSAKVGDAMSLTEKAREVIHDVKDIKEAQALITNQLENIRKENTHLYGDMSYVREKIGQQAIIVDKLLHFLMTMIGGRRTFLKRSYPYLLEDDGLIEQKANALQYVQVTESATKIGDQVSFVANPTSTLAITDEPDLNEPLVVEPVLPSAIGELTKKSEQVKNDKNDKSEKPSASSKASAAEITMVADEIGDDINALKDILKAKTGMHLPKYIVEKIFDNFDTMVPAVPTAHLVSGSTGPSGSTSEKAGSVSVSSVTAHVLEDLQITQQELIDVAAQTQIDKFQERSKIPISVKKVQVLLAEEIPPNSAEMPPPRRNIDLDKDKGQGTGSSGGGSKSKEKKSS